MTVPNIPDTDGIEYPMGRKLRAEPVAFYNEIDPFAAAWLRELITAGLIAPGIVDERDIRDIRPDELAGYTQCHFFAGFGTWSLALREAGWRDDEPVWTASCPCPPFSSAGPNFRCPECDTGSPVPNAVRTGAFDCIRCGHEWQADERHLFPELLRLIRKCRPERILGEQVASKDGRTWLDVVSASLEMLDYAVGSPDTCAAGFGAPHIRQREYWVADSNFTGFPLGSAHSDERGIVWHEGHSPPAGGVLGRMAHADGRNASAERQQRGGEQRQLAPNDGAGRLADASNIGHERPWATRRWWDGPEDDCPACGGTGLRGPYFPDGRAYTCGNCDPVWMADANSGQCLRFTDSEGRHSDGQASRRIESDGIAECGGEARRPGPTNGLWRDVDWLCCTDGKWRPVEPGTFPLADAGTFRNRVAELRGAGNAINLAQAQGFIEAVRDIIGDQSPHHQRTQHPDTLDSAFAVRGEGQFHPQPTTAEARG